MERPDRIQVDNGSEFINQAKGGVQDLLMTISATLAERKFLFLSTEKSTLRMRCVMKAIMEVTE